MSNLSRGRFASFPALGQAQYYLSGNIVGFRGYPLKDMLSPHTDIISPDNARTPRRGRAGLAEAWPGKAWHGKARSISGEKQ